VALVSFLNKPVSDMVVWLAFVLHMPKVLSSYLGPETE
jgi:hypothetical protein